MARASEPRHDSPDRHLCGLGNFPIVEAFDIAQHECFAEQRRQIGDRQAKLFGVDLGDQRGFRRIVAILIGCAMLGGPSR